MFGGMSTHPLLRSNCNVHKICSTLYARTWSLAEVPQWKVDSVTELVLRERRPMYITLKGNTWYAFDKIPILVLTFSSGNISFGNNVRAVQLKFCS